jgi:hypothetical protein
VTISPPAIEFRIFFESDPSTTAPALSHSNHLKNYRVGDPMGHLLA